MPEDLYMAGEAAAVSKRVVLSSGLGILPAPSKEARSMEAQIIGALIGAFVGWLICAIFGPGGHFEAPNLWIVDNEGAIGCLGQLAIVLICAVVGFFVAPLFV